MNINAIQAFVYTAEMGSISAAAKKMGRNRVQLSQWISNLEVDWDTQLFIRDGHKPVITDSAQSLLLECKQLLEIQVYLEKKVSSIQQGYETEIKIGVSHSVCTNTLIRAIADFNKTYPNIDCQFFERSDEDLLCGLESKHFTLSIAYYVDDSNDLFDIFPLETQPVVAVCSSEHPLANIENVTIMELNQHVSVASRKHTEINLWPRLPNQRLWQADSLQICLELVKQNLAWTVCPEHKVKTALAEGRLNIINHPDAIQQDKLGVIWQKHRPSSQPERHLIDCFKRQFTPSI